MYSLGEVNFIQGMHDLGNCKNSVGLKPIAVRLRATALHVRPPGVETPGYSCVVPKGLERCTKKLIDT
jgi:hypothetical protein